MVLISTSTKLYRWGNSCVFYFKANLRYITVCHTPLFVHVLGYATCSSSARVYLHEIGSAVITTHAAVHWQSILCAQGIYVCSVFCGTLVFYQLQTQKMCNRQYLFCLLMSLSLSSITFWTFTGRSRNIVPNQSCLVNNMWHISPIGTHRPPLASSSISWVTTGKTDTCQTYMHIQKSLPGHLHLNNRHNRSLHHKDEDKTSPRNPLVVDNI